MNTSFLFVGLILVSTGVMAFVMYKIGYHFGYIKAKESFTEKASEIIFVDDTQIISTEEKNYLTTE